jgi:hypothetical protein
MTGIGGGFIPVDLSAPDRPVVGLDSDAIGRVRRWPYNPGEFAERLEWRRQTMRRAGWMMLLIASWVAGCASTGPATDDMRPLVEASPEVVTDRLASVGTDGVDQFADVAVGPEGDIYAAGFMGGEPSESSKGYPWGGDSRAVVGRWSPDGERRWLHRFGGEGRARVQDIEVADDGTMYVASLFEQPESGEGEPEKLPGTYLMRWDGPGQVVWEEHVGGYRSPNAQALDIGPEGDVWSAAENTTGGVGGADVIVTRFNAEGDKRWESRVGGKQDDRLNSIEVGAGGHAHVAGFSTSALGGGERPGNRLPYVAKLEPGGGKPSYRQFHTVNRRGSAEVVLGAADSQYVLAGLGVDPFAQTPFAGETDAFAVRIEDGVRREWTRVFGRRRVESFVDGAETDQGYVFAGGTSTGTTGLWGTRDAMLVATDRQGRGRWYTQFGTWGRDWINAVAPLGPDRYVVALDSAGRIGEKPNQGKSDAHLMVVECRSGCGVGEE